MHSSGSTASNFCVFEVNWCRKDRATLRYYSLVKKCLKNGDIVEVSAVSVKSVRRVSSTREEECDQYNWHLSRFSRA